jgi:hypothetical protein
MISTGQDDPHDENTHLAALIERSSLGTREGRLRRSTVSASTGRAIARSAMARSAKSGRYVSAATAARHPRTTVTESGRRSGGESPHNPKGSTPSDDL